MFNFTGTFTVSQFEALKVFAETQKVDLLARRQWLVTQLNKLGTYGTTYDKTTGEPIKFVATPRSYAEKLLEAYRILGGIPEKDMMLRDRSDPVFLQEGSPIKETETDTIGGFSDTYSNNRRYRGGMRFDRDIGMIVTKFKKWQFDIIKRKREHLEYKMKRVLDASDQIANEIAEIDVLLGDGRNSFDALIQRIEAAISDPSNINVTDGDAFGLAIGKPADLAYENQTFEQLSEHQRGGSKA
jgi:hypothetical protein